MMSVCECQSLFYHTTSLDANPSGVLTLCAGLLLLGAMPNRKRINPMCLTNSSHRIRIRGKENICQWAHQPRYYRGIDLRQRYDILEAATRPSACRWPRPQNLGHRPGRRPSPAQMRPSSRSDRRRRLIAIPRHPNTEVDQTLDGDTQQGYPISSSTLHQHT